MITRQQMEIINRKTLRYPLHIAEKDYLLALVLQHLAKSPLGEKLVFKGGTAVHHCYLEQHRFSEDLGFLLAGYEAGNLRRLAIEFGLRNRVPVASRILFSFDRRPVASAAACP